MPSTVTWINPAGGDWDTAANWQDATTGANRVPGAADDAVISQSGITVTHSSSNSDTVNSLTSQATLSVSNGNLTLNTPSTTQALNLSINGTLTVAAPNGSNPGSLEVQDLTQSEGTLTGPGTVTVDGALVWTGGTMSGTGGTEMLGTGEVSSTSQFAPVLRDGRQLDNFGTFTIDNNSNLLFNFAGLNNQPGALLVLQDNAALGDRFGSIGTVTNSGTLLKTGHGNTTASVAANLHNLGNSEVQFGTLNVTGGLTNDGTFTLDDGAVATLNSTFNTDTSSGSFELGPDSNLSIGATFTFLTGATADLAAGSEMDFNGTVTQQGGTDLTLEAGSVLGVNAANNFGATYTLADGATIDGAGVVRMTGPFSQTTVTGAVSISNLFLANGTLAVTSPNPSSPGPLDVQNLTQVGATLTGPGTVIVDNSLAWSAGVMSGSGVTVLNGTSELSKGGFIGPQLSTRTMDNFGQARVDDGTSVTFLNNATWINEAGATLTLAGSASLTGPVGKVTNAGTLVKSGADSTTSTVGVALDNTGTVRVQSGTFNASGGLTNEAAGTLDVGPGAVAAVNGGNSSGAIQLEANSLLGLGGTFVLLRNETDVAAGGEVDVNGTLTQVDGAVVNLAAGALLNVGPNAGRLSQASYTLQDGSTVSGGGAVAVQNFFASMTVNGSVSVSNLTLSGGTVTVNPSADLDLNSLTQSNGTLTGDGTVTVEGRWTWTGGFMSGRGQTVVNGTGTVGSSSSSQTFAFLDTRTVDNNGTVTLPDGDALVFLTGAVWTNESGSTLVLGNNSSLGTFFGSLGKLNNFGLVEDTGPTSQATIDLNLGVTNGGTVDLRGLLHVLGGYTQTADGTLTVHLGPGTTSPTAGELQASGSAALDGTLNVVAEDGFSASGGQTFFIMTFNGLTGDFGTFTGLDLGNGQTLTPGHTNTSYTLTVTSS